METEIVIAPFKTILRTTAWVVVILSGVLLGMILSLFFKAIKLYLFKEF
jgi:hypothetical protein